jgi:hypothetical protein
MSVNLTRKQQNALGKGKNIRVKHTQMGCGAMELELDGEGTRKYNSAMRAGKGMTIKPHHIKGGSLKSTFKKLGKTAKKTFNKAIKPMAKSFYEKEIKPTGKKALQEAKLMAEDILEETVKPMVKDYSNAKVREARANIDKSLKDNREISEKKAEKLLTKLGVPKSLAQDLITDSSMKLSKAGANALDKIEGHLIQDIKLKPGIDYEVSETLPVAVAEEMPVAMVDAIEEMKPLDGSGRHKFVYLKGGKLKIGKLMKKIGRNLGKLGQNKAVRNILSELGSRAISSAVVGLTGNPIAGEMASQALKPLTNEAINAGTDALAGMGRAKLRAVVGEARQVNKTGGAMYMSGMSHRGGSMYITGKGLPPVSTNIKLGNNRKLL